jgi:TRAP-type mannitol/chloroaromatic compound transport system substrate-binding protein
MSLLEELHENAGYGDLILAGFCVYNGAECFGYFNKEINSLDDFKGLKFRTAGMWGNILADKIGASVVQLPGGEVYQSAERGVIDAFEFSSPGVNWPFGFHEIVKYLYMPGIHSPVGEDLVRINPDAWNALSPDLQGLVIDACWMSGLRSLNAINQADVEGVKLYEEYAKTHDFEIRIVPKDVQKAVVETSLEWLNEYADSGEEPLFGKVLKDQLDFFGGLRSVVSLNWPSYDF